MLARSASTATERYDDDEDDSEGTDFGATRQRKAGRKFE
jgi:hypothetical protein